MILETTPVPAQSTDRATFIISEA